MFCAVNRGVRNVFFWCTVARPQWEELLLHLKQCIMDMGGGVRWSPATFTPRYWCWPLQWLATHLCFLCPRETLVAELSLPYRWLVSRARSPGDPQLPGELQVLCACQSQCPLWGTFAGLVVHWLKGRGFPGRTMTPWVHSWYGARCQFGSEGRMGIAEQISYLVLCSSEIL